MKSSSVIKTCSLFCTLLLCNCSAKGPARIIIITEYGDIELQLYDKTPQHRDNFIKLVKDGYYDGTLFHRVIKQFMIQGGDPNTKNVKPGTHLGSGGPGYTVPAEFVPEYIHKRGALAAARQGDNVNPEKASSGSQFYIVQGKVYTDEELNREEERLAMSKARPVAMEYVREEEEAMRKAGQTVDPEAAQAKARERAMKYIEEHPYRIPEETRQIYKTIGGTPFLDTEYTVFGEVIKGMEIVDQIANMETDQGDRPKVDVKIKKIKTTY
jgi:cyclophilin family peptidyl-prolyl cis-trans isomerase